MTKEVLNMPINIGEVSTFPNVRADKAQVVKIGEECMEVFSAWERWTIMGTQATKVRIVEEAADVIQACANLAAALGVDDMREAMKACEERNRKRGRL